MLLLFFVFAWDLSVAYCLQDSEQIYISKYYHFSDFDAKNLQLRNLKNECHADTLKKIQKLVENDVCLPRLTMVELTDPDPSVIKILPQNALLQRCAGGHNTKQHGCLPAKTKSITIPVVLVTTNSFNNNLEQTCSVIIAEEHLACKFGCKITSDDCNSKQVFRSNACRCECANEKEVVECAKAGKMWIDVTCSCECVPSAVVDCSTGFSFDQHSCRCELITRSEETNNFRAYVAAMMKNQNLAE